MTFELLPPFNVMVSTPSPRFQVALHFATYAAGFDEALHGHKPGFGLRVARGRGIGYNQHQSFLPFDFLPLSLLQLCVFGSAFHILVL